MDGAESRRDDAALFERWLDARDADAFAELARRHAPVVYDLAVRALGDRSAAEDVVQEALLDLALTRTRKPVEVGVVAWLARFAVCRALNRRASEQSRARRQRIAGAWRTEGVMPDHRFETAEELEHALASADPDERMVLAMRYLHGWEYSRVAAALRVTEGTARVRVHRALEKVRERVGANGGGSSASGRTIARGLAALPLCRMGVERIDAAVRHAVATAAEMPAAPASQAVDPALRAARIALQIAGAAILVVSQAAAQAVPTPSASAIEAGEHSRFEPGSPASSHPAGVRSLSGDWTTGAIGAPRPPDWDGGALRRLRPRTAAGNEAPPPARGASSPTAAASPAQPAAQAGAGPPDAESPGALRPNFRGAEAANCAHGSPDGERADAPGGSASPWRDATVHPTAQAAESAAGPTAAGEPEPQPALSETAIEEIVRRAAARREHAAGARRASAASLDDEDLRRIEEAADLVRSLVEADGTDGAHVAPPLASDESGARAPRERLVRSVKQRYRELRRTLREAGALDSVSAAAAARPRAKGPSVNRLIGMLVDVVLADGRPTASLRWPDGVDVGAALSEVIRVLGTGPVPGAERLPDVATSPAGGETE